MPPKFLAVPDNDRVTERCQNLENEWKACLTATLKRTGAIVMGECAKQQEAFKTCITVAANYAGHRPPLLVEDGTTVWGSAARPNGYTGY